MLQEVSRMAHRHQVDHAPLSTLAWMLPVSMLSGSLKRRTKDPKLRSTRV
jgi:hypothetical protein